MSPRVSARELRQVRQLSRYAGLVVLAVGIATLTLYLVWDEGTAGSVRSEVAYVVANVCFSASLVAILLGRVTFAESNLSLKSTLEETIQENLLPLRETVESAAQSGYSWRCVLSPPSSTDKHLRYAYQQISIEKTLYQLPSELRFVCVAADKDDAIAGFVDDSRYQLRWLVDPTLDPNDRHIFDVRRVSVNGTELTGREIKISGRYIQRVLAFPISPAMKADNRFQLSFDLLVRKYLGEDQRVRLNTQVFAPTFGADFWCVVSENIRVDRAWFSATQIGGFGPIKQAEGSVYYWEGFPTTAHVRFDAPLQRGSGVDFNLEIKRP
jgi:hypothetical protein